MKPKFTPGPWKVSDILASDGMEVKSCPDFKAWTRYITAGDNVLLTETRTYIYDDGGVRGYPTAPVSEWRANCRLIAAAPQLYDLLRDVLFYAKEFPGVIHDKTMLRQIRKTLRDVDKETKEVKEVK